MFEGLRPAHLVRNAALWPRHGAAEPKRRILRAPKTCIERTSYVNICSTFTKDSYYYFIFVGRRAIFGVRFLPMRVVVCGLEVAGLRGVAWCWVSDRSAGSEEHRLFNMRQ